MPAALSSLPPGCEVCHASVPGMQVEHADEGEAYQAQTDEAVHMTYSFEEHPSSLRYSRAEIIGSG